MTEQRLQRRHLRERQAILEELHALDAAWPYLDMAATEAVNSGAYTLMDIHSGRCREMNALLHFVAKVESARKRHQRLKGRMDRVLTFARDPAQPLTELAPRG